jgi:hypothetical protein
VGLSLPSSLPSSLPTPKLQPKAPLKFPSPDRDGTRLRPVGHPSEARAGVGRRPLGPSPPLLPPPKQHRSRGTRERGLPARRQDEMITCFEPRCRCLVRGTNVATTTWNGDADPFLLRNRHTVCVHSKNTLSLFQCGLTCHHANIIIVDFVLPFLLIVGHTFLVNCRSS